MDGGLCLLAICGGFELLIAAIAAFIGLVVYLVLRRVTGLHPNAPAIIAILVGLAVLITLQILLTLWMVPLNVNGGI